MSTIDLPPSQELLSPREQREQRLMWLREKLDATFPGEQLEALRGEIEASFSVPQVGEYHNEGGFMDSHLKLIFDTLEEVKNGRFPEQLLSDAHTGTRELLTRAFEKHKDQLDQYVFLHDISKKDCLTLKYTDGRPDEEITWTEWQTRLEQTNPGLRAQKGDESALMTFCEESGIESIGYFHASEGGAGKHGTVGGDRLVELHLDNEDLKTAIQMHEIAFVFNTPQADVYREHFGSLPPDAQDFAILATYVDTLASIRKDGKPDLEQFIALVESRKKEKILRDAEAQFDATKYEKNPANKLWADLWKGKDIFTDTEQVLARLDQCKIRIYDEARVRSAVDAYLVQNPGTLTDTEVEIIIKGATTDPTTIGRALGKNTPRWKAIEATLKQ